MTQDERKKLPKKRARREEIDTFYLLSAAMSAVLDAERDLKSRAQMIPGGWRDLRMIRTRMENLLLCLLHTRLTRRSSTRLPSRCTMCGSRRCSAGRHPRIRR